MAAVLCGGWAAFGIVAILSVLEISLSFDNAVVNAGIVKKMNAFWQKVFLTISTLIAVFGMRLVFPVLVSVRRNRTLAAEDRGENERAEAASTA